MVGAFECEFEAESGHNCDQSLPLLSVEVTNIIITVGKLTLRTLSVIQKLHYQPHAESIICMLLKKTIGLA